MYYEEQIINGKLCWRGVPNGEWIEFTNEQLTRKLQDAQHSNSPVDLYEKAPWWANPALPPIKFTC